MSNPVDISRERIERLHAIDCADYIHLAMLDRIEALQAERDAAVLAERKACAEIADEEHRVCKWHAQHEGDDMTLRLRASYGANIAKGIVLQIRARSKEQENAPDFEGFTKAIMEEWQEHWDIEPSEKFELAVKFNILKSIPGGFDPETHDDPDGCAEPGDPWYELNFVP